MEVTNYMNTRNGIIIIVFLLVFIGGELAFLHFQNNEYYKANRPMKSYLNYSKSEDNLLEEEWDVEKNMDKPLEEMTAKKINLMIVAHPDDETLWGGAHLLQEDYYVVCVTCGNVEYRDKEFKRVMLLTENNFEFLGYPDVVNGYISDWRNDTDSITKDLKRIIDSRDWDKVVTHNPDGEYGHFHHKKVSNIVTSLTSKKQLYYFGKYYSKENIPNMEKLEMDIYNKKKDDLINVYASQPLAIQKHYHMLQYENFIQYYDWN